MRPRVATAVSLGRRRNGRYRCQLATQVDARRKHMGHQPAALWETLTRRCRAVGKFERDHAAVHADHLGLSECPSDVGGIRLHQGASRLGRI